MSKKYQANRIYLKNLFIYLIELSLKEERANKYEAYYLSLRIASSKMGSLSLYYYYEYLTKMLFYFSRNLKRYPIFFLFPFFQWQGSLIISNRLDQCRIEPKKAASVTPMYTREVTTELMIKLYRK